MATRTLVACSECGEERAYVPRTAVALLGLAVCAECASKRETAAVAEERARYAQSSHAARAASSRKALEALSGAPFHLETPYDDLLARKTGSGLLVVGKDVDTAETAVYRHLWLTAGEDPAVARHVGGGPESLTLAAYSKAGFADAPGIRAKYLSPVYTAIAITGIGGGGFLNTSRKQEEWGALLDATQRSRQYLVLGIAGESTNAQNLWSRIGGWMGETAATRLQRVVGKNVVFL